MSKTRDQQEQERLAYHEINRIVDSDLPSSKKFARFYDEGLWQAIAPGINKGQSKTGFGSTLQATALLRPAFEQFLRVMNVETLFDAPCGDFHWMRYVLFEGRYIGGDIVPSVIADNREFCASVSREFVVFDITKDEFPAADAWLCRACLQHLSYDEILAALDNFRRSNVKMALLSNSRHVTNYDIKSGGSRMLDLTKPPFNLSPPKLTLPDNPCGERRSIGVWYREDLT